MVVGFRVTRFLLIKTMRFFLIFPLVIMWKYLLDSNPKCNAKNYARSELWYRIDDKDK